MINNEENNDNKEEEIMFGTKDEQIHKLNDYDSRYLEMLEEI